MKRGVVIGILVIIFLGFIWGLWYVFNLDKKDPVIYETEQATTQTIVKKTVATGSIVPRKKCL